MSLRDDLRPTGRNRVIDLVRAAGIDVSDWSNFARGPNWAAANPKYCYEWSFVDRAGTVVLNLWFENIDERRGTVSVTTNMRQRSQELARRGAKAVWIKRAARMDDAIRFAVESKALVRVIVNDGDMRKADDPEARASVVHGRLLDPLPWTITKYNPGTGAAILVRGAAVVGLVDQFDVEPPGSPAPETVDIHGKAFRRSPAVRAAVLVRASGRCEFCGSPGFVTAAGQLFLETHHIVPLSEDGADVVTNAAALCANHHREAHFGAGASVIREFLLEIASND